MNSIKNTNIAPKVSIGIPCYNHENLIEECLDSIREQKYPNIEVYISDDCSLDNSRDIIGNYKRKYPNFALHCIHPAKNLGIAGNFNHLMNHMTGEYVSIFAGDDIMLPDKILEQVRALEADKSASFCYSNMEWFNHKKHKRTYKHFGFFQTPPKTLHDIIRDFTVPTPSLLVRRSMQPNPAYKTEIPHINDFYNIVELMLKGKAIYIPKVLVKYRRHNKSITATNYFVEERKTILQLMRKELPEQYRKDFVYYQKIIYYAQGMESFRQGKSLEGLKLLIKTIPHSLTSLKWCIRLVILMRSFFISLVKKG